MGRAAISFLSTVAFSLVLNGCMAMGFPGMGHHGAQPGRSVGRTVIRQLHTESAEINLEIPPLFVGEEATITVGLGALQGGAPISDALVTFRFQRIDRTLSGSERGPLDDGIAHPATARATPGSYLSKHTFEEQGTYEITARIWTGGKTEGVAPLMISEIQEVTLPEETRGWRRMGAMGLVGGAGMVLMMVIGMGGLLL